MAKVKIGISPNGRESKVEVEGASGPGCRELTGRIERALGASRGSDLKPEYYEEPEAEQEGEAQP